MTTKKRTFQPSEELVSLWCNKAAELYDEGSSGFYQFIADKSAQWAANQQLEECCDVLEDELCVFVSDDLKLFCRPDKKTLKEKALSDFNGLMQELFQSNSKNDYSYVINRISFALESLPE